MTYNTESSGNKKKPAFDNKRVTADVRALFLYGDRNRI